AILVHVKLAGKVERLPRRAHSVEPARPRLVAGPSVEPREVERAIARMKTGAADAGVELERQLDDSSLLDTPHAVARHEEHLAGAVGDAEELPAERLPGGRFDDDERARRAIDRRMDPAEGRVVRRGVG